MTKDVKIEPRGKVRFVIGDLSETVMKPKTSVVREFEKEIAGVGKGTGNAMETMSRFLMACGLTEAFVEELGYEGTQQVLEALMPEKKTS